MDLRKLREKHVPLEGDLLRLPTCKVSLAFILAIGCTVGDPSRAEDTMSLHELNGRSSETIMRGFGDRLIWEFDVGDGGTHAVSSVDIVLGGPSIDYAPKDLNASLNALRERQKVGNASFMTLWVTPAWNVSWYQPSEVQRAMSAGLTPVFMDWFFGDSLVSGDARGAVTARLQEYSDHGLRLGRFLGQFDGDVLVVMEPELNKSTTQDWPEFGHIIREHGIAAIRAGVAETNQATGRQTEVLFGAALNDNGQRSAELDDSVYGSKAEGDSYGWTLTDPLMEALLPDLDFIGFQELIGQFHRDPASDDGVISETEISLGLDAFPQRILNYSAYLHQKTGLPVFIPYIGLATSTWEDRNGNGAIDDGEIEKLGWEREVGKTLSELRDLDEELRAAGVVGMGTMMLFDDPAHDLGGYQYLLDNEYAIGLVATNAEDGVDGAHFGMELENKSLSWTSYSKLFFGSD